MASLRHFSALTKTRYAQTVLPAQKNAPTGYLYQNLIEKFNYLKILDLYPLLEKFVIISFFKWGLVIKYSNLYNLVWNVVIFLE